MADRPRAHTPYAEWPPSIRATRFPFLELPAELQNHVYSFTFEDPIDEDHETVHLTKRNTTPPTEALAPVHSRRQFFGLTQVCHLMRQQFRPIYVERNEVVLRADESLQYANMMLDAEMFAPTGAPTAANIVVDVATKPAYWLESKPMRCEEMLPILKVACIYPRVSVRFAYLPQVWMTHSLMPWMTPNARGPAQFPTFRAQLQQLFQPGLLEIWRDHILRHWDSVRISATNDSLNSTKIHLAIILKQGFLETDQISPDDWASYATIQELENHAKTPRLSKVMTTICPHGWVPHARGLDIDVEGKSTNGDIFNARFDWAGISLDWYPANDIS